jgi:hypothetical protein
MSLWVTKAHVFLTRHLRGDKPDLDLQCDLSLSRDGLVVRLLEQRTGMGVVSRRIVDMDLLPHTGVI